MSPDHGFSREYPDGRPLQEQGLFHKKFPTDTDEDNLVSRLEFTKCLVLTSGAMAAGQCWIAANSLLGEKAIYPEKAIVKVSELPPGGAMVFHYPGDEPCVLARLSEDKWVAYGQKCTHLACAVIPRPSHGDLYCPCHRGFFEIENGRPIAGPPRRPLPRVTLAVRDGVIYATGWEVRSQ
ncbi:MAG: Rieske (2Fe-2S) protein [Gemmataceae bacterium]|nr:Rieske (2Fe-2S) protein [Gemmataceae bacterium]